MDCGAILAALPLDVIQPGHQYTNDQLLQHLAQCMLDIENTDRLLPILLPLLPELAARWLQNAQDREAVIAAFGRIVPTHKFLLQHARQYLEQNQADRTIWQTYTGQKLTSLLLGLYRLCTIDIDCMTCFIKPAELLFGLQHSSMVVRFLVIRVLCLYLHAADAAMQQMVQKYIGEDAIDGPWEQQEIDYRFLVLWEGKRLQEVAREASVWPVSGRKFVKETQSFGSSEILLQDTDLTASILVAGILVPRIGRSQTNTSASSQFVETPTALDNMQRLIAAIYSDQPALLTGAAGAGKTTMVRYLADRLGKLDSMVTLQLNEQSDVKILLGLYTTGKEPGTFVWKPGVLTTAVREGRWVFIEDLDRAPNEVISALLPLMERNELILPGRTEAVKAAAGFKLIATIQSASTSRKPLSALIGKRFWCAVDITHPTDGEIATITTAKFPALASRAAELVEVFAKVRDISQSQAFRVSATSNSARPATTRDYFKWCRRIRALFSGPREFTAHSIDSILLEAVDCFAGYLPDSPALHSIVDYIAQEMQIDPQRRDHILQARTIKLNLASSGSESVQIGRVTLHSDSSRHKRTIRSKVFSSNSHTVRVLEKIAAAVNHGEPLLLVGETGTGKTTTVQHLADLTGKRLVPFNLSQQSESSDVLGGFKPVDTRAMVLSIQDEFEQLFAASFSTRDNAQFTALLQKSIAKAQWRRTCKLWQGAISEVKKRLLNNNSDIGEAVHQRKKQRLASSRRGASTDDDESQLLSRWKGLIDGVNQIEARLASRESAFAFTFVEGNIVKAARNGDWVLLDEVNLAAPDTLEAIADLLSCEHGQAPSILLTEAGKVERVFAHKDFRVFAAMNPATDVGKRDLPAGIRSRFTEIYVESPDKDLRSLQHIVQTYLGEDLMDKTIVGEIAQLHLLIQQLSNDNKIVDSSGQRPHFSLRTLTRGLTFARDVASLCGVRRGLFEGFSMSYLTFLDKASEELLLPMLHRHIFRSSDKAKNELKKSLRKPSDGRQYIAQRNFWLRKGTLEPEMQAYFIITPFVERNLDNLVRAIFSRRAPVLIQGPTSSGKTSMVEYLAKISGHKFVRINNHEHTDLQEYLGTYVSDANGALFFQEGILVEALRNGYWIVLDELNLAPSDVLEALNRLLDDNRELFIPETQETVKPHEDFMLFATQNPAGLYGGRKPLSRAFRNRFLELHFDDIPIDELCEILHRRTQIPESWSRRIVEVYKELSALRQETRLFENKSFATLRDLFRWALRGADSVEQLALNGYMLLGERVRKPDERDRIKEVIEKVMGKRGPKVQLDIAALYAATNFPGTTWKDGRASTQGIVWTHSMRRLYTLVSHAIRNNEPVLLVGDTGCGKTTVCQMLAQAVRKPLSIVNAHQNTETGDIIGSHRPVRNKSAIEAELREMLSSVLQITEEHSFTATTVSTLITFDKMIEDSPQAVSQDQIEKINALRARYMSLFEWNDGSLVQAMREGGLFLLDEISLADDSVLERLNSVLEPQRSLFLAEKGPIDSTVVAADGFQFFATMNPGGDYGKRELSPALRNRFTEIWVPPVDEVVEIREIVDAKLPSMPTSGEIIVQFAKWFGETFRAGTNTTISIRDMLACVAFLKLPQIQDSSINLLHAISMVFIDSLGANPAGMLSISHENLTEQRRRCVQKLEQLTKTALSTAYFTVPELQLLENVLHIGDFSLPRHSSATEDNGFTFLAPTTRINAMRIVRALQLSKPLLIEGDPGVGKTTIVSSLAKLLGRSLVRINLSEQTDLMDLFGSDVPVDGESVGAFAWRDAPFLTAMKNGDWLLLDEMNLASQSVLEGLNACLDHRGEVYIAELGQAFSRHPEFRLFAAQNPHHQGGGRKGLPASYVNRFTVVYADPFTRHDLDIICQHLYPDVEASLVSKLTGFVSALTKKTGQSHAFGTLGQPWEFNLRDALRWLQLSRSGSNNNLLINAASSLDLCDIVFGRRFRAETDQVAWQSIFHDTFQEATKSRTFFNTSTTDAYQVGLSTIERPILMRQTNDLPRVPIMHLPVAEGLLLCIKMNWPVILVGDSGAGKSRLIEHAAAMHGVKTVTMTMNADIDAMDLIGGFEQADPQRRILQYLAKLKQLLQRQAILACAGDDSRLAAAATNLIAAIAAANSQPLDHVMSICVRELEALGSHQNFNSADALQEAQAVQRLTHVSSQAKFDWVDGLLVRALVGGNWLVLDNANLCSSSVLDRLNSLLEPNGRLIINENPLKDGKARVLVPHPNFRIFLTMDPRHGELSRAMRNRALEFFVPAQDDVKLPSLHQDAAMARFHQLLDAVDDHSVQPAHVFDITHLALDHLTDADTKLMQAVRTQLDLGLSNSFTSTQILKHEIDCMLQPSDASPWLVWRNSTASPPVRQSRANHLKQFLTLHPLNNVTALQAISGDIGVLIPHGMIGDALARQQLIHTSLESIANGQNTQLLTTKRRGISFRQKVFDYVDKQHAVVESFLQALSKAPDDVDIAVEIASCELLQISWLYLTQCLSEADRLDMTIQISLHLMRDSLKKSVAGHVSGATTRFSAQQYKRLDHVLSLDVSSGWFMEPLWDVFRPCMPPTFDDYMQFETLARLADRFDSCRWSSDATVEDVVQTCNAFARVSALLKGSAAAVDVQGLLADIDAAIIGIESSDLDVERVKLPIFQDAFDFIWRRIELALAVSADSVSQIGSSKVLIEMFAGIETKELMDLAGEENACSILLKRLIHYHHPLQALAGKLTYDDKADVSRERSVTDCDSVPLRSLDLLRSELQLLGKTWACNASLLCSSLYSDLKKVLGLINVTVETAMLSTAVELPAHARDELSVLMAPVQQYLAIDGTGSLKQLGLAYIHFATFNIINYVPQTLIDPLAKQYIASEMDWFRFCFWNTRAAAFLHFDRKFDGCESFRTKMIVTRRNDMGHVSPPSTSQVAQRPRESQMEHLQQEFDQVMRLITMIATRISNGEFLDKTTRESIAKIVDRLRGAFRAYTDLTLPLIGFLTMLMLGMDLCVDAESQEQGENKSKETTLFSFLKDTVPSLNIKRLRHLALLRNLYGNLNETERLTCEETFDALYHQWKKAVETAQAKNSVRSNLYTFKGSYSDEEEQDEEEFEAMFPDEYISAQDASKDSKESVLISNLYIDLYLGGQNTEWTLLNHIRNSQSPHLTSPTLSETPIMLLHVRDQLDRLDAELNPEKTYNIYKDANIGEAKKLIRLIRRIQARFQTLHVAWPEHATIHEVRKLCDEVLDFNHSEPVIKFLTKCEKLHGTIYEWQKVASKEYTAVSLYDELTSLLISWRRLELSTWLRLFDNEVQTCTDDAQTWWFVAYESVITASESIVAAQGDLPSHALRLTETLEHFIRDTSIGQFATRLRLLSALACDLEHRKARVPELNATHTALCNFIAYYSNFVDPIHDRLKSERKKLERDVKEVVQLASWKDTNIDALKQSARTSHRKLFKVVRKFRSLLHQPATAIVDCGPPDMSTAITVAVVEAEMAGNEAADHAVKRVADEIVATPEWPSRFRNVDATVRLMNRLASNELRATSQGASHLSETIMQLHQSIERLQKATPSLLTDDNKDMVKHLKVQKRALFADVLKQMRLMGLQYNLSTSEIERQSNMAKVMATVPFISDSPASMANAEQHFHRLLPLMQSVREVQTEHSADLTAAEVSRSSGYLEALWQKVLSQRTKILSTASSLQKFQSSLEIVSNIANAVLHEESFGTFSPEAAKGQEDITVLPRELHQLTHACEAATVLINTQCSLGQFECQGIIEGLERWFADFQELSAAIDAMAQLPEHVHSTSQTQQLKHAFQQIELFNHDVGRWIKAEPLVQPVLSSLLLLATATSPANSIPNGYHLTPSFDTFRHTLFKIVDTMLAQVQILSSAKDDLPASTTTHSWYVLEDTARSSALKPALILSTAVELQQLLNEMHRLDPADIRLATLLLTSIAPILHKFYSIIKGQLSSYIGLHEATAQLTKSLGSILVNLGKNGFCTPRDKSAGADAGQQKLEGGTGLGEGEGAEDISKDIGEDEDLTELAEQQQDSSEHKDMEDEQDAVDMADADLQGQEDEVEEHADEEGDKDSDGEDNAEEEMDDEVGDVDDLGPSAVDEKMWDSGAQDERNDKEKDGGDKQGSKTEEQVAAEDKAEDNTTEQQDSDTSEFEMPDEQEEGLVQDKDELINDNLRSGENLDLPEEMEMDAQSQAGSEHDDDSDDLNNLNDISDDNLGNEDMETDNDDAPDDHEAEISDMAAETDELDDSDHAEDAMDENDTGDGVEDPVQPDLDPETVQDHALRNQDENETTDDAAPSDTKGSVLQSADDAQDQQEPFDKNDGAQGTESNTHGAQAAGDQGAGDDGGPEDTVGRAQENGSMDQQPFKKLGDVLEKWYNQQKTIQAPPEVSTSRRQDADVDMKDVDFEHLDHEDAEADAQALGAATQEQASALNPENAVPVDEDASARPYEEDDVQDPETGETEEAMHPEPATDGHASTDRPKAFVGEPKPLVNEKGIVPPADNVVEEGDVELDLSSVHISVSRTHVVQTYEQARSTWLKHESTTRALAATLSEQLRLILAPTTATKLRGDFKTGKRLNIKRIIPYIASSYKRDKIWMRRSIPSKRNYQIMIALDDSKSMADVGKDDKSIRKVDLAFQTLALVAKSLSMLEAGDLCFLGFGQEIKNAHAFGTPFTDDAGAGIFQSFDFQQEKTDVRKLIAEALELFRVARARSRGATADLWQLMLIISDGVCEDHTTITQLVRQAQDERIMIVFVIVDQDPKEADDKAQSIMDLQSAEFKMDSDGEMKVVRTNYMDTFPFRWWIVVRDVRELPIVLATALRQWFSEIVDNS